MSESDFYLVGDVQGCAGALKRLVQRIPEGRAIWLCGDLVNRGADSLGVLRQVKALGSRARVVLGNHDIHLLAVAAGARKLGRSDTLDGILNAPDREAWLDWLRFQPVAHYEQGVLMVHAGVLPSWSLAETLANARALEAVLRSDNYKQRLQTLFGNEPNSWSPDLAGDERLRVITNAFTRLRLCDANGAMDFKFKGELQDAPTHLMPWFAAPERKTLNTPIFFGHWSALGLHRSHNTTCLDTGCVWGRDLTAYHHPTGELLTVRE
ncbi:Bis(5'-nucleosyl)-tetraphosphatase, symmetrical [Ephemeroptericola cinctiostellae]|uniref:bis(5'-nucleosyl)-tetraphosphatase (symmetrical) n=1 Tax=Ephemeroptericola cinctiostellae TaxID=2268024 RepID=A0A345DA36_9BURK|nr:symmetrical bis(5'-nucleosyl)-tetraphosphatase [Ephemeroptericola cinctiostellae]AXF85224.1 Bis(5'-nucleosyl)-tetraphosphatase, symmetrical [Ephemeroptericola cinctiostellae]